MPREGARRAERRASRSGGVRQLEWRSLRNLYHPIDVISADQIEAIHQTSLRILAEIGMDFLHPEALSIFSQAGAMVEPGSNRVRFDPDWVIEKVSTVPDTFALHARNPEHNVTIGGNHINFATVASPPNASDADRGRRSGNFDDFQNLIRLAQSFNIIHLFGGYPVEPVDLPPSTRHLDCLSAVVTLGDKAFHSYALGRERMTDAIEIARIARGVSAEQLCGEPSLFTVVNTSSPLRLDGPMIEGLIEMARMGQVVIATPFTLSGAMAPATIAGALAQQNAEALSTIALIQCVNPGAPAMYGGFTSNVDMRSGAPAFGTPEYTKAALAGGQLARRYGFPYRSSNACAANAVDSQAAYEAEMSTWGAVMGHANLIMHGAGWMEGGLTASFEKFIIDVEILQMMSEFLQPLRVDEASLALDAIAEVGPGGHFFGAAHTLERYESAFYSPIVSDWRNFESWELAGSPTAEQHANRVWKEVLEAFSPPPLPDDRAAELTDFVERRRSEGGVSA
ncbi:MAG TPA: trimethylamine methyltransferase family protein [Acidimicrobiia bacterium]|jgi:trimethylamine--corrinoid protein Co-methyltransferase|nr:trimethylamine methyltransferase family protein [Acidimicrobiia bacterium]